MRFEIEKGQLLRVCKLMEGFIATSYSRPILNAVHIVCDDETQTVLFESTNAMKVVRWSFQTKVIEKGECSLVLTKPFMYLLKQKTILPFNVIIYNDGDVYKANINENIIVLEVKKDKYPNIDNVYDNKTERYDYEPTVDIEQLRLALNSMEKAGATTVKLSIPKKECQTIKMTCVPLYGEEKVVSLFATMREFY